MTTSKNKKDIVSKIAEHKNKTDRKYLTATTIIAGIITLIDENGEICYYRQRGINQLPDNFKTQLISVGFLNRNWYNFKELPKNITISFEDEAIMGKASATFPARKAALILNQKLK